MTSISPRLLNLWSEFNPYGVGYGRFIEKLFFHPGEYGILYTKRWKVCSFIINHTPLGFRKWFDSMTLSTNSWIAKTNHDYYLSELKKREKERGLYDSG